MNSEHVDAQTWLICEESKVSEIALCSSDWSMSLLAVSFRDESSFLAKAVVYVVIR